MAENVDPVNKARASSQWTAGRNLLMSLIDGFIISLFSGQTDGGEPFKTFNEGVQPVSERIRSVLLAEKRPPAADCIH